LAPVAQQQAGIVEEEDQRRLVIEDIPVGDTSFQHQPPYIPVYFLITGQRIKSRYIEQAQQDGRREQK
jgi:hypothetical protein